jgi:hypothetical protein
VAFLRSLEEAAEEGEREGFFTAEEVGRDARAAIRAVRDRRK